MARLVARIVPDRARRRISVFPSAPDPGNHPPMTLNAAKISSSPPPDAIRTRSLGAATLPLVIEPMGAEGRSVPALRAWITANRKLVRQNLTERGALLFRGFAVDDAAGFERVARAVDPYLKNDYLGTSPRNALTSHVFSASELPPYYPIPQHCEMSFTRSPPSRLFFCCFVPSSGPGGETPLCDFRKVYEDLEPAVRARFLTKGVRIIRNYVGPEGGGRFDLWKLKRWDEMFQTTDRAVVEAACAANGFEFTWLPGGRLRLINTQPAVKLHPVTGEPTWFNHSQVFHLSAAAGEYRRIAARLGKPRFALLAGFAAAMVRLKQRSSPLEQAMHCTFGDGTPIPDADMEHVRDAIWKNMVFIPWRKGDVMAIDNFAVAHGRMPYQGPRTVAVAWA
jgi:alpha-ketoglutarate-dependent taurine dioxygenase